jgi:protein ImuB
MHESRVVVAALRSADNGASVQRLAQSLAEIVALSEVVDNRHVLFAMKGPARFFGGEEEVVHRVVQLCRRAGIDVGVGVAESRLAAMWAASVAFPVHRVPVGETAAFLAPQPVADLARFTHVGSDTLSLLSRLGLGTIGAVAGVPRASLSDRFGPDGDTLAVLCAGGDLHAPRFDAPPDAEVVVLEFDDPLDDLDAVLRGVADMLHRLVDDHVRRGLVVCRIAVSFVTEHDDICARVWYHPEGFGAGALVERVRGQLEAWSAVRSTGSGVPTAGVSRVVLEVHDTAPRRAHQLGLWGGRSEADRAAHRAIARVRSVVGDQRVTVPEWRGGRDPLRQYVATSVALVDIEDPATARRRVTPGEMHPARWNGVLTGLAPSIRVDPPMGVEVLDSQGRTVAVNGRHLLTSVPYRVRVEGSTWSIVQWWGPWPVEERWWDPARHRRVAHVQCIVASEQHEAAVHEEAWLLSLEQRVWWLVGTYG